MSTDTFVPAPNKNTLDTLNFPGQVNVLRAEIISHKGQSIDISLMMAELSLYEDIFSNTMSGHVYVQDSLDLINTVPIIGQELFMLELQTPSFKKSIKKKFYIYKLDHRIFGSKTQYYMLHFCSTELITSANTKVSKAFSGKISDTVINLVCKAPDGDSRWLASEQQLFYEETKNSCEFIAPYWTPLQTINWLCEKAVNPHGASNYLFYETNQAFEFYSLDELINSGSVAKYTSGDTNTKTMTEVTDQTANSQDMDRLFGAVKNVQTDVSFDYLRNLSAGMYGSILYTFDTTLKKMSRNIFNYFDEFPKTYHLEDFPVHSDDLIFKKQAVTNHLLKNNYITGVQDPVQYSSFFQQRKSSIAQLLSFKFILEVFGRTDIAVADIIDFEMINKKELTAEEIKDPTKRIMKDFEGRCLITAIRHSIVQGVHSMEMEVSSDSFKEKAK